MSGMREFKEATLNITNYISIRHFGPLEEVNSTWSRLIQFAFHLGISGPEVIAFGLCCDYPPNTPPDQIRYDACLSISPAQHENLVQPMAANMDDNFEGIRLNTLKVGKTMMTVHRGPYSNIRDAYTDALEAAALTGIDVHSHGLPTIEVYKNNPLLTKPEALITEIHFLPAGHEFRVG